MNDFKIIKIKKIIKKTKIFMVLKFFFGIIYKIKKIKNKFIRNYLTHIYIISYPKCGRTWIRIFLSKYFSSKYFTSEIWNLSPLLRKNNNIPRIIFDHTGFKKEAYNTLCDEIKSLEKKRIIFLIRDPRDVVISHYFHVTKRNYDAPLQKKWRADKLKIFDFIRHEFYGIERIIEYYNRWYQYKDIFRDFLLVKYENCKYDQRKEFIKILNFIGENEVNFYAINNAIKFSDFENMQDIERKGEFNTEALKVKDPNDAESYKVRKGKVGGYTDYLDGSDIEYVNEKMKFLNKEFEYSI